MGAQFGPPVPNRASPSPPLQNFFFLLILSTLMVPVQVTSVALYVLLARKGWVGPLMAATVISTGPMLLAYAISQKFMIRGIALTGLKA